MSPNEPIKRLNYFDHQFLREQDFNDEQAYHIRMRQLHTSTFHTWGIANGLKLQAAQGSSRVTITEGVAVDSLGQEIVLIGEKQTDDLSSHAGKTVYITIAYDSVETDPTSETGATGNTRITDAPRVGYSETPPGRPEQELILGRVPVDNNGKIDPRKIDDGEEPHRRRSAGAVAGDLEAHSLVLSNPSVDPKGWPRLQSNAANQADLQSSLKVGGDLEVTGKVDGRDVSADGAILDAHVKNQNNPHNTTAQQIGALPLTGGVLTGGVQLVQSPSDTRALYVRGNAYIEGELNVVGNKVGYVVDICVNGSGQRLQTGDAVKLKGVPITRFQGLNNKIPVPEVTLADKADDTMVIGIVDAEVLPHLDAPDTRVGPEDPTFIENGGELYVVTLGAYAHCKVDASAAPIAVGDLLTTSNNPGYARKATEPKIGSIIGKALEPLPEGTGYIAVFVNIH